jgi:hypothetical protein
MPQCEGKFERPHRATHSGAGDLVDLQGGGLQDTTLDEPVVPDACLCAHANLSAGGAGVGEAARETASTRKPKNSVQPKKCGKRNCLRYAAEKCSVRIPTG